MTEDSNAKYTEEQAGEEKEEQIVLLSEYLNSLEPEMRAGIRQRVVAQVNDGSIIGLVHLGGHVMIEMRSVDRGGSATPRRVREVLLQNDEALVDALTVIENEVRLEMKRGMASHLDIETVREVAAGGDFAALAAAARLKVQRAKRKRDREKARVKGQAKPKAKRT